MEFVPEIDMDAIDGVISVLSSRSNKPKGHPFSKITVYSVCPEVQYFMPHFEYVPAASVPAMRKLDFKKAGKVYGSKVQEMKNDLSQVPDEFIITSPRFDVVDEPKRKTTSCRKHLVEVECDDMPDLWLVVQFRKSIKKYITEELSLNIVPAIFRDTFTSEDEFIATGQMYKDESPLVTRVIVTLGNCSERLYQALQVYGVKEFTGLPIRIQIPSRQYICNNIGKHVVSFADETARFNITTEMP